MLSKRNQLSHKTLKCSVCIQCNMLSTLFTYWIFISLGEKQGPASNFGISII